MLRKNNIDYFYSKQEVISGSVIKFFYKTTDDLNFITSYSYPLPLGIFLKNNELYCVYCSITPEENAVFIDQFIFSTDINNIYVNKITKKISIGYSIPTYTNVLKIYCYDDVFIFLDNLILKVNPESSEISIFPLFNHFYNYLSHIYFWDSASRVALLFTDSYHFSPPKHTFRRLVKFPVNVADYFYVANHGNKIVFTTAYSTHAIIDEIENLDNELGHTFDMMSNIYEITVENNMASFKLLVVTKTHIFIKKYTIYFDYEQIKDTPHYKPIVTQKDISTIFSIERGEENLIFNKPVVPVYLNDTYIVFIQPRMNIGNYVIDCKYLFYNISKGLIEKEFFAIETNSFKYDDYSPFLSNEHLVFFGHLEDNKYLFIYKHAKFLCLFMFDFNENRILCSKKIFETTQINFIKILPTDDKNSYIFILNNEIYIVVLDYYNCSVNIYLLNTFNMNLSLYSSKAFQSKSAVTIFFYNFNKITSYIIDLNKKIVFEPVSETLPLNDNIVDIIKNDDDFIVITAENYFYYLLFNAESSEDCSKFYIAFVQKLNDLTPNIHKLQAFSSLYSDQSNVANFAYYSNTANNANFAYYANNSEIAKRLELLQVYDIVNVFSEQNIYAEKKFTSASFSFFKLKKRIKDSVTVGNDERLIFYKNFIAENNMKIILKDKSELIIIE